MRVVVTRPQEAAGRWVQALALQGVDAVGLPLIEIRPAVDSGAIQAAWQAMPGFAAVMFVSAAAVQNFFFVDPQKQNVWPSAAQPRAWAPGPGTASALLRQGVPAPLIDAPPEDSGQFDSEALWLQVGASVRPGQRVLVVRGSQRDSIEGPEQAGPDQGAGRDWLARRLAEHGALVEYVVAYRRAGPAPAQLRQAIADLGLSVPALWLFTSSQAIENLASALPRHDWSASRALVTHPRIAAAARAAGFGVVWESRPTLADVLASIKSAQ
ncbi:MAG: uroporphyrinogen-III synthase [Burkholderiaceae bacterium]